MKAPTRNILPALSGFLAVCLLSPSLIAQVPQIINYQGRVAVGSPPVNFDGTGSFRFALVNADGGTNYWSNDPAAAVSLAVTKGLYSVLLGDTNRANMAAIPPAVFTNSDVRLRVWFNDGINGFQQITPDQRIAAVGYAMVAGTLQEGANIVAGTVQAKGSVQVGVTNEWGNSGSAAKLIRFGDGDWTSIGENNNDDQLEVTAANVVFNDWLDTGKLLVDVQGTLQAGKLIGDGSGLTNIPASAVIGGGTGGGQTAAPAGMVFVPSGEFTMGNSTGDTDITDATPTNTTVSAFYMDATEVTLAQWQAVSTWGVKVGGYTDLVTGGGRTNAGTNAAQVPVVAVNWHNALKWCNARSEREGKTPAYYTDTNWTSVYKTGTNDITSAYVKWDANGYRLPTEAEWERAARGGLTNQRFPWGDTISQKLANYYANTSTNTNASGASYDEGANGFNLIGNNGASPATLYTTPIATFAANKYGLSDMAGNVQEWVWDYYGTPYQGGTNPHGAASGTTRVLRGGYWGVYLTTTTTAPFARCAARVSLAPTTTNNYTGFRTILPQ